VRGGGKIAQRVLFCERGAAKQCIGALLVATAGRMDQRRAEGEPGFRFELVRAASFRLGRRASERTNAGIEAAGVDGRAPRLQARTGALGPATAAAAIGAGGVASAARNTAAPGAVPRSARNSSRQAETCRFAASRSPASE
jgi:hypothetical protein